MSFPPHLLVLVTGEWVSIQPRGAPPCISLTLGLQPDGEDHEVGDIFIIILILQRMKLRNREGPSQSSVLDPERT